MKGSIRNSKISIALTVILLCVGFDQASAQRTVPVELAIQMALENNLQIKQSAYQEALSEQDLRQAKMDFYPSLNLGTSGSMNWGLSFDQTAGRLVTQSVNSAGLRLSTGFDVFRGFQQVNQVKANKMLLEASKSQVDKAKNDLILMVVTTYLEALTNLDLWAASEEQSSLSKQQLEVMRINMEAGNNTLADLSQAQTQVANDELNITTAQNAYEMSMLNLKQLMEMDPQAHIELQRPILEDALLNANRGTANEIFNEAVNLYPEIKVASFNTEAAKRNIEIAKGGYYPTLSFSGGIGTNYSSQARDFNTQQILPFGDQLERNRSESIGLSLNIPIFNNGRVKIGVRRAQINYQNAQTSELLTRNNFNKVINQAVLDLRSSEKKLYATESALKSAKQTFEVIQLRFNEGMANAVELSTSQIAMNKAEFDHIQARYNLVFNSKVIDFYLGKSVKF